MISKILILPVGLTCNLRCKYCTNNSQRNFFNPALKVMEEKILYRIFSETKPLIDRNKKLTIIWNGGESTLAGLDFYRMAVELEKEIFKNQEIENGIQTNGTLIDDEWCEFFKKENFAPSISLDGPSWMHNRLRVDSQNNGTYDRVFKSYQLMKSYDLRVGILGVITPYNVDYPEEIMNWLKENNINNWDFLLSFEPPESDAGLTINNLKATDFMIRLFDAWFNEDNPKIRIRTFRDVIRSELGNKPTLCSWQRGCLKFISFDNLGNAFLCTKFHIYPETGYGNILEQSLENILSSQKVEIINQTVYDGQHECRKCQWVNSCGGGCSFIRYALHKKFNAPFMYCGARKTLFQHIRKRIF
ncbi:MAG: radical SAM protein [Patescibacteria group bacterium]